MRKWFPIFLAAFLGLGMIALLVYANRERMIPETSIPALNEAEHTWYSHEINSYTIVVDVLFETERREHVVTVTDGAVSGGIVRYWDETRKSWSDDQVASEGISQDMTVPGLFEMIRQELVDDLDRSIRVVYSEQGYPKWILLGEAAIQGEVVQGSSAEIRVMELIPAP